MIRDASAFHRIAVGRRLPLRPSPGARARRPGGAEVQRRGWHRRGRDPPARRRRRSPAWPTSGRGLERGVRRAADDRPARPEAQLPRPRDHPPRPDPSITLRDLREAGPPADSRSRPAWRSRPTGGPSAGSPSGDRRFPGRRGDPGAAAARPPDDRPGLGSARREAAPLAAALGLDFHVGGLSSEAKAVAVRSLRERGLKVAYVGDCRREPDAAREAYVAISMADAVDPAHDPRRSWSSGRTWAGSPTLRERSRSHVDRIRTIHGCDPGPEPVLHRRGVLPGLHQPLGGRADQPRHPGRLLRIASSTSTT